ncbi:MAG: F0F1 ATP synthase subunit epsilon [Candidatus Yonathbacteria bacterium]|nr:F0F1 ATP synthase subunit epsilon [Candidatus Yonathbacteria bacterium]
MFKLIVAQVDKNLFQGEVAQVTCPGADGDLTILPHHSALVTPLRPGELKIVDDKGVETRIPVASGVLEVGGNEATIIL